MSGKFVMFSIFIVFCLGVKSASTQDNLKWTLLSNQDLSDFVGDNHSLDKASLSPDGSTVAWVEKQSGLCLYVFSTGITSCYPWLDENYTQAFGSLNNIYLEWSPDSEKIALAEYPFSQSFDSDIWLFKLASRSLTDLTQDNVSSYFSLSDGFLIGTSIDYLPKWNPENGDLIFFRSKIALSDSSKQPLFTGPSIYRVASGTDTPELIQDLSNQLTSIIVTAAISPNGNDLAFFLLDKTEDLNSSLWILNLTDNTLKQMAASSDFLNGMPTWAETWQVLDSSSLMWLNNENLIAAGIGISRGKDTQVYAENYHYINIRTGEISPLINLSDLTANDAQFQSLDRIPRVGFISASGDTFFYIHYAQNRSKTKISYIDLPPYDKNFVLLNTNINYKFSEYDSLSKISSNDKALISGRNLLTFASQ